MTRSGSFWTLQDGGGAAMRDDIAGEAIDPAHRKDAADLGEVRTGASIAVKVDGDLSVVGSNGVEAPEKIGGQDAALEGRSDKEVHCHEIESPPTAGHIVEGVGHNHLQVGEVEIEVLPGKGQEIGIVVNPGDSDVMEAAAQHVGKCAAAKTQEERSAGLSGREHGRPVPEGWINVGHCHRENHPVRNQRPVALVFPNTQTPHSAWGSAWDRTSITS
jgi:hypothetical protein